MSALVVVGAQWGDEGKGKVVDLYTPYADLVVRYAGGANAGHTLVVGGEKQILHLIPSGILHEQTRCVVGQGTVIDPAVFLKEVEALKQRGVATQGRLLVSQRAHVVLPHHKLIDELREKKSGGAIGTTKRGIGPCYEDKVARRGVRMGDLLDADRLQGQLEANLECWLPVAEDLGGTLPSADEMAKQYADLGEALRTYIGDAAAIVRASIQANEKILLEGAQGTMLDIDNGTYPFVTSSNAVAGGACAGAGIGPTHIRSAIGIAKAYTTRVGGGPFPTELENETGQRLRDAGAEYGLYDGTPPLLWLARPRCAPARRGGQRPERAGDHETRRAVRSTGARGLRGVRARRRAPHLPALRAPRRRFSPSTKRSKAGTRTSPRAAAGRTYPPPPSGTSLESNTKSGAGWAWSA